MKRLRKALRLYEAQLQVIRQEIKDAIGHYPLLKAKAEKITSLKGVGLLTAATIIAENNGFALFTSHKQLTSYAGYDVVENQSGRRSGKAKISEQGNSHIRRILHMPALSAVSLKVSFISCRALYETLTGKGKKKMISPCGRAEEAAGADLHPVEEG